ncbi:MAG: hypothetical protein JXQ23_11230 [Clostridia bacterium]|nr:hypothetical protein [Clostridia bacterium]
MKHIFTSKRIFTFLLSLIIIISCSSCVNTGRSSSSKTFIPSSLTETQIPSLSDNLSENDEPVKEESLKEYKAVLQNNREFFNIEDNESMDINHYIDSMKDKTGVSVRIMKFSVIDLDADGSEEIILWEQANENEYFGFLILHYHDEAVYGYFMNYRGFYNLKNDGTFSFSGGAMDSGFGTAVFHEMEFLTEKIAYSQSSYDSGNNLTVSFHINGDSTTQEKFNDILVIQDEKPDVTWYDFTEENIESTF